MTEVPDDATLCSLSLKSKNTLLNFDDGLVLSLSGIALMTSHRNFPLRFKTTGKGLKKYAWQDLVLSPHLTQNTTAWCQDSEHPEASCVVPATEQTGAFDLKFLDTTVESIAEFAKDNNKPLELMLTVTGDNDAGKDCRFSPIEFTVDATYAP